jgi:hypothetical protein
MPIPKLYAKRYCRCQLATFALQAVGNSET